MTDPSWQPPIPSDVRVVPTAKPTNKFKPWIIAGGTISALIVLGIAAGLSKKDDNSPTATRATPATQVAATVGPAPTDSPSTTMTPTSEVPTTTAAPTTTEATATTLAPECVNGSAESRNVTDTAYDSWNCVGGTWTFAETIAIAPPTTPAAPSPPTQLTEREWKLLVKDPDAHTGERIIVFGYVTQFDAATGDTKFRANIDGIARANWLDYNVNSVMGVHTGEESLLADVVNDDMFTATVLVAGSWTYDTQIGGTTTVPLFVIQEITVTGSRV